MHVYVYVSFENEVKQLGKEQISTQIAHKCCFMSFMAAYSLIYIQYLLHLFKER